MGFYIEELPTELNGITMKEADYLADEFLKDTPCNRMWDAMRALRDFYETVTSKAIEVTDYKTEPTWEQVKEYCNKRCLDIVDSALRKKWYKDEPQTDCSW